MTYLLSPPEFPYLPRTPILTGSSKENMNLEAGSVQLLQFFTQCNVMRERENPLKWVRRGCSMLYASVVRVGCVRCQDMTRPISGGAMMVILALSPSSLPHNTSSLVRQHLQLPADEISCIPSISSIDSVRQYSIRQNTALVVSSTFDRLLWSLT